MNTTNLMPGGADAFVFVNADYRCTNADIEAARLLRLDLAGMLGRPLWELLARILDAGTVDAWRSAIQEGHQAPVHLGECRTEDGRRFACRCLPAASGLLIHLVSLGEGNSEVRAIDEERRRMDDFLAMLAHELRNPLAALCQGLALLRMPQAPEEDLDRTLDSLERQLAYALRIVADLYDASRIKRGRMELRQGPVCVQQLIGAVLDDMEKAVAQKQHRVEVRVAPEITVHGDWARLSQAFKNLVANAISYTEPGGDISIAAHERQDEVECRVRDSGRGIPPEMLPYLFETNYHQSSAPSSSGLGIGLGIVRRIVELHGGTVTAHSDGPGRGAEFVVRLPRWSIGE